MMMRHYILLFSTVMGLTACQSGFQVSSGNRHFQALTASRFVLHQDIRIPPRQAHAFFQRGAREPGSGEFAPHCELEVRKVLEVAQTVHAGVFDITSIRGFTHYVKRPDKPVRLAAANGFQLVSSDSAEWIMQAYHFSLHSNEQPDVLRLICGGAYDYPYYARYPSLEDMQLALGEVGSIRLR